MLHTLCYRSFYQDGAIESNEKVNQKVLNFCPFVDILITKSTLRRCETFGDLWLHRATTRVALTSGTECRGRSCACPKS